MAQLFLKNPTVGSIHFGWFFSCIKLFYDQDSCSLVATENPDLFSSAFPRQATGLPGEILSIWFPTCSEYSLVNVELVESDIEDWGSNKPRSDRCYQYQPTQSIKRFPQYHQLQPIRETSRLVTIISYNILLGDLLERDLGGGQSSLLMLGGPGIKPIEIVWGFPQALALISW